MHIKGIICYANKRSLCYDLSAITLTDALASQDGTQTVTICLADDDDNCKYIDLSMLYADQPISANGVVDWEGLAQYLTNLDETVLDNYRVSVLVPYRMLTIIDGVKTLVPTPFSTDITAQLNIYSVENNFGIDVGYGSHLSPNLRNNNKLKWNLPDLVFSRAIPGEVVNFKNTIPVVNGVVCYPKPWNDVLFAYQGAKLAAKVDDLNKNIVLIDYSQLGNITTIKLSDCEHISTTGLSEKVTVKDTVVKKEDPVKFKGSIDEYVQPNVTIEFYLPPGVKKGYPMVCIAGRMFEPSTYHVSMYSEGERYRVVVTIDRHLLEVIIASNLQKFKQVVKNTNLIPVIVETTINNLFIDPDNYTGSTQEEIAYLKYADKTIPFVSILHSEEPVVHNLIEPIRVLYPDKLMFPVGTGGLLINKYTREIVDYVMIPYDSGNLITFPVQKELHLLSRTNVNDLTTRNLAFGKHNAAYTDKYNPFSLKYQDIHALDAYLLYDLAVARTPVVVEAEPSVAVETAASVMSASVEPVVEPVPTVTRLTANTINVLNGNKAYNGLYVLADATMSGIDRVWNLYDQAFTTQVNAILAYDKVKLKWFIGTADNHIYESNATHNGSSPWHSSINWYKV